MRVPKTFPGFLQSIQNFDTGELGDFIKRNEQATGLIGSYLQSYGRLMPAVYILDYTQRKYVYASSNMRLFIDHPLSRFLDGGLDFGWQIFQKDDLKVYGENVLYENLKFIQDKPVIHHNRYVYTCNYRVKDRKGVYRQIRQQSLFIKSAPNGMPLATLGFLFDVSPYIKSNKIIHTIEDTISGSTGSPLLNNVYFPYEQDRILSPREIEVLKWICDGLSSQAIADKLFISRYTINAHRRHILEKTNSRNLVDLIKYAIQQDYL